MVNLSESWLQNKIPATSCLHGCVNLNLSSTWKDDEHPTPTSTPGPTFPNKRRTILRPSATSCPTFSVLLPSGLWSSTRGLRPHDANGCLYMTRALPCLNQTSLLTGPVVAKRNPERQGIISINSRMTGIEHQQPSRTWLLLRLLAC